MKVAYRNAAREDIIRQFRYYLVTLNLPEIAVRFRDSISRTVQFLRNHPNAGSHYRSDDPRLQGLRSWPVAGFEAIRIYYLDDVDSVHVVRILHAKRDVGNILAQEEIE